MITSTSHDQYSSIEVRWFTYNRVVSFFDLIVKCIQRGCLPQKPSNRSRLSITYADCSHHIRASTLLILRTENSKYNRTTIQDYHEFWSKTSPEICKRRIRKVRYSGALSTCLKNSVSNILADCIHKSSQSIYIHEHFFA
jgi:hypothetical protein